MPKEEIEKIKSKEIKLKEFVVSLTDVGNEASDDGPRGSTSSSGADGSRGSAAFPSRDGAAVRRAD